MFSVTNKKKISSDSQHSSIYLNKTLSSKCNVDCYLSDIQKLPDWRYVHVEADWKGWTILLSRFFTKSPKCKVVFLLSPVLGSDCATCVASFVASFLSLSSSHPRGPIRKKKSLQKPSSLKTCLLLIYFHSWRWVCVWQEGKLLTQVLPLSESDSVCSQGLSCLVVLTDNMKINR